MSDAQTRSRAQAEMGIPVLAATGIEVAFGGLRAVTGTNVEVAEKEIVAVIGPNGAGKTTLLNAVSGLVGMTGDIRIAGVSTAVRPRSLALLGVARSYQSPQLIEEESAVQNVVCGAHLRTGYSPWAQVFRRRRVIQRERVLADEARELLEHAHLVGADVERPVHKLTHGMRKRVDLTRALMSRPRLLLMDEPTAGMGSEEREIVEGMTLRLRDQFGAAVLMVEHHMDVVRRVADRVVAMQTGGVLRVGPVAEVLGSEEFRVASLGRDPVEPLEEGAAHAAPRDQAGGG